MRQLRPPRRPLEAIMRTRISVVLAVLAAALVAGCGTVKNTIADGDDAALMLRGNDPVAYFTDGKPTKGSPAIKAGYNGATYRFATEQNKATFMANPARYEPQYAGFCASGAPYALKAFIDADTFAIVDGKLYLFGSPRSRRNWMQDYTDNIRTGDAWWQNETKDVPYRLQNARRYTFKVDGYKTDAELDALFAQRKAARTLNPLAVRYEN
jgi:YHS domain-containing protein